MLARGLAAPVVDVMPPRLAAAEGHIALWTSCGRTARPLGGAGAAERNHGARSARTSGQRRQGKSYILARLITSPFTAT